MAKATLEKSLMDSVPHLLKMPSKRTWIDYDEEADVLYLSFQKPQRADDSEVKDNIVFHYRGKNLVGVTIIGAKNVRVKEQKPKE